MRRYLIIFLAALTAVALFFMTKYILNKLTMKNSIFISSLIGLLGFIIFILISFLFLEKDAADPSYNYIPPKIQDGKMLDGNFVK
ncbi:hypothetical protein OAD30_00570 [Alphaproteobacteria bacterium]|nr:hypothetical protein [Alphaproteobacteria bacterium]